MAKYLFLVFTKPQPGQDDEFNRWYTDQHLGDVLRLDGFVAAQRFRLAPQFGASETPAPYLAIYEIEADDPQAALAELPKHAGTAAMPISGAMDPAGGMTLLAEPICERVTA